MSTELSPRMYQVAEGIMRGRTYKSIARKYGLSISTVTRHAERLFVHYGVYTKERLAEKLHDESVLVPKEDLARWMEEALQFGAVRAAHEIRMRANGAHTVRRYVFLAH